MIISRIWCAKCDCYRLKPRDYESDMCVAIGNVLVSSDRSLRPRICDVCRDGGCYRDLRLSVPPAARVDEMERRVRSFLTDLTFEELRGLSLAKLEAFHADRLSFVARLDGAGW